MPWYGALRSRDFRKFWLGFVISVSGLQMLWMVQGWLVYELSNSKILLGVVGLAQAAPSIALTFVGGVLADRWDQRSLIIVSLFLQVLVLASLAALSFLEVVEVWHVLVAVSLRAAIGSFEAPARHAMFPHLLDRSSLTSAIALNASIHPGTRIFGPALAGLILWAVVEGTSSAKIAAGSIFALTALGLAVFALLLLRVHMPPVRRSRGATMLHEIVAGIGLLWRRRIFGLLIGTTYYSHFFALSVTALFPVFAKDILGVGPSGLGFLYTATGIGSLVGALTVAQMGGPRRWRSMIVGGLVVQGAFLALFAYSSWYPLSLFALLVMGAGSAQFNVAAQSTIQLLVTNEFRGRIMGVWELTHSGARPLGEIQVTTVATLLTPEAAVALGGALVVAFALLVVAPNRRIRELRTMSLGSSGDLVTRKSIDARQARE